MDTDSVIDPDMIAELKELLCEDFEIFLDTFTRDMAVREQAIDAAFVERDVDALRQALHSLKGSSSNLGANQLSRSCAKLEQSALQGDFETVAQMIALLHQQCLEVAKAIENLA